MSGDYGKFCVLEGIDSSGKSSIIEVLKEHRTDILYTAEPTDSWIGTDTRQCIEYDQTHPLTDCYMMCADRAHHLEETIFPAMKNGTTVLSDRYTDSTRAYQSVALQDDIANPEQFIEDICDPFPEPDLVLYIDIPVDVALKRGVDGDKYERRQFLEQVKANYDELEEKYGHIKRVDGNRSLKEVASGVKNLIELAEEDMI